MVETEYDEYKMEVTLTRTIKATDKEDAYQIALRTAYNNFGREYAEPHFEFADVNIVEEE